MSTLLNHHPAWLAARCLLAVLLLALCLPAPAQPTPGPRRVALVVGNASYPDKPLVNPLNDAADMAAALRRLGFEVLERSDRNPQQLREDLADFRDRLRRGDVALFFFAGHGVQTARGNYLLPVGMRYRRESDVELHALEAASVLRRMEESEASLSMVILDACRDNPLPAEARSADSRGLARMDAPIGSLIAFATAPGRTADENRGGRNGLFTQTLLQHIETPGLKLEELFKRVRRDVVQASRALPPERRQVPEEVSKLTDDFYFRAATPTVPPGANPGLDLGDLQREQQARTQWQAWQGRMRSDFDKLSLEAAGLAPDLRVQAWERFLATWKDDNPLSGDDEALRVRAQQRLSEAQQAAWVAVAPSPRPQPYDEPPRDVSTGLQHRQVVKDCDVCPELVVVSDLRTFDMGSPVSEPVREFDERQRRVQVARAYAIGKTEVTQAQWRLVMGNNPSKFLGCDDCPVERVSWNDAQQYLERLNQLTGRRYGFRLPSEAEWEYAARAGTTTPFWTGYTISSAQANYNSDYTYNGSATGRYRARTTPVGEFGANPWGLHDVHGNVWEWTQDCYGPYAEAPTDGAAKEATACTLRVLRGGSWGNPPQSLRSAGRVGYTPGDRYVNAGFRIARTVF